jgi:hypothetical protein
MLAYKAAASLDAIKRRFPLALVASQALAVANAEDVFQAHVIVRKTGLELFKGCRLRAQAEFIAQFRLHVPRG